MAKKNTKRILRIAFVVASISSLFFVPWLLVKAWIIPLPDTIQEQADEAIEHGMLATAEDVGTFLRAWNDGSLFEPGEQEIYASIYKYEHAGWVPGYQSFAKYH